MKSPLTGKEMKLMSEPSTLNYKGKTYNVIHHYYLCELTKEHHWILRLFNKKPKPVLEITQYELEYLEGDLAVLAPTFRQASKFFRDKFKLNSWVESHYDEEFYPKIEEIRHPRLIDRDKLRITNPFCKTYREAEIECLNKLIELSKKN